ncbi:MAG: ABC transporter ATP-binding protein [Clostridia bacterium]|nr:ABC transporter ATP-binding protein [Clostridia bacterium]
MLEIKDLCINYGADVVFNGFNLVIESGQTVCILGRSGCGKTTLLNAVARIVDFEGSISGQGRVSYVFQQSRLLPNKTVLGNIVYALGEDKKANEQAALFALNAMGIAHLKDKYPSKISGGEAGRAALARAFACGGDTLLMDEPFRALDIAVKRGIISRFITTKSPACTAIFVTHDVEEALMCADRIIVLGTHPCNIIFDTMIDIPAAERDVNCARLNAARADVVEAILM